jgi:hypothetical protein
MKSSTTATDYKSMFGRAECGCSLEPASIGAAATLWIVEDAARLPIKQVIIDAECCCAGDDGVTDFDALHSRVNDHTAFALCFRSSAC